MQQRQSVLSAEAITALERGNRIEAIKITRESTGLSLKEAKDAIDAYLAANPAVKQRSQAAAATQIAGFKRGLLWVVVIAVVVVAYLFTSGRLN